jgi:NNMT/PNMT/TEMT family
MKQILALDALRCIPMADVDTNALDADALWNRFSSNDYWRRNYSKFQAEDQEIIRLVSHFLASAFADRAPAQRAIDVGSGTNIYPALLMLPWTERILLADYSESNVSWLHDQVADDADPWAWRPFWREMRKTKGYSDVDKPRKRLREACVGKPGYAGIERLSIFDLPEARFDLGTMFFVAESITKDPEVFRTAVECFVGTLKPGAPFAAAFMAGSDGYEVAQTVYPAVPINSDDVMWHLSALGVGEPSVELLRTSHRVRDGYEGMIVATGFASKETRPGKLRPESHGDSDTAAHPRDLARDP